MRFDVLLDKIWEFISKVKIGDTIESGNVIGIVKENESIEHKILVPPARRGVVKEIRSGEISGDEPVAILED